MTIVHSQNITMKDVAREAGLSVATVSAVVNEANPRKRIPVSSKARTTIMQTIRKLNYQVNEQARSLRTGRSSTVAVVTSGITHPFSSEMIRLVERELYKKNYHFLILDMEDNTEQEVSCLALFRQKKVDGILFIGATELLTDKGLELLVDSGVPLVLTDREMSQKKAPCILVDNIHGSFMATEHLIRQGYHRIAYITGPERIAITHQRNNGYRQALQKHGLDCSSELVTKGGLTLDDGYRAMEHLLNLQSRPQAVFAFNDMVAIGAIRAIRDRNLQVPSDVAVVGYDDIPMAAYTEPPLTTIRQPILEICVEGVRLLLGILDGDYPVLFYRKTVLEPELIVRKTCGNPLDE